MLASKFDLTKLKSESLKADLIQLTRFDSLSENEKQALGLRLNKLTLLTPGSVNPKTAKKITGHPILNYILHLSPANLSGINLCPAASNGCKAACLNTAGRGRFDSIQLARLRKSLFYRYYKQSFLIKLHREISRLETKARRKRQKLVIRLNGTSDIPYESLLINGKSLFDWYPNVQFYDYTKIISRLVRCRDIPNYNLTFSLSESNDTHALYALSLGYNVAAVFRDTPIQYLDRPTIDGDKHDFRFLDLRDSQGYIVALKAKGKAKQDKSGFVRE